MLPLPRYANQGRARKVMVRKLLMTRGIWSSSGVVTATNRAKLRTRRRRPNLNTCRARRRGSLHARLLRLLGYPHKQNTCYILTGRREVHIPLLCSYRAGRRLVDGEVGRALLATKPCPGSARKDALSRIYLRQNLVVATYIFMGVCLLGLGSKRGLRYQCDKSTTRS